LQGEKKSEKRVPPQTEKKKKKAIGPSPPKVPKQARRRGGKKKKGATRMKGGKKKEKRAARPSLDEIRNKEKEENQGAIWEGEAAFLRAWWED